MPRPDRVLVSGGAGGVGSAVCELIAARGLTPVVGYHRDPATAQALALRLQGDAIAIDLSDTRQIDDACTALAGDERPLVGVVLAASPPPRVGPFGTITEADMTLQWQVNVDGPQRLVAGVVRSCFRPHKRGAIVGVLTSGMGAGIGSAAPNLGAYLIAKHGLLGVLALAAADYPWLRVRSVSPGFIETSMLSAFDERYLDQQRRQGPFLTTEQVATDIVAQLLAP